MNNFLTDIHGNKSATRMLAVSACVVALIAWICAFWFPAIIAHCQWGSDKALEFAKWVFIAGKGFEEIGNGVAKMKGGQDAS